MPRTIHLTPALDAFVDQFVAGGRYETPSEVMADALSLLEDREAALQARAAKLKAQIAEGLADIEAGRTHDIDEVFAELDEIIERAAATRDAAE